MARSAWLPRRDVPRHLRRKQTAAERIAWSLLRRRRMLGLKFRRQHPVAGFVLDFYCAELRLAIELDGCVHDDPQQRARDAERTRRLEALRIQVVRIPNSRVSEANLRHLIHPFVPPLRVCGEGARG